jgi:hypothetical protein
VQVAEGLWVYKGEWRKDLRWGNGCCTYADGSSYEGQWVKDFRNGHGIYTGCQGLMYDGHWEADQMHGTGELKANVLSAFLQQVNGNHPAALCNVS